ncbi:MAG: lytic transglycosylase domain-containing protein [Succinivibrio sp.]|nr:lytic transglycosylase domain-containing protein [Succinivibrio sp.]
MEYCSQKEGDHSRTEPKEPLKEKFLPVFTAISMGLIFLFMVYITTSTVLYFRVLQAEVVGSQCSYRQQGMAPDSAAVDESTSAQIGVKPESSEQPQLPAVVEVEESNQLAALMDHTAQRRRALKDAVEPGKATVDSAGKTEAGESFGSLRALCKECAPLVHESTLAAVALTESSFNPYAVAIVGGRGFSNLTKAQATKLIGALERTGANYSVGLMQVNKVNFKRFGVSGTDLLDPCLNLKVGAEILSECYERAGRRYDSADPQNQAKRLGDAMSCYYAGNFSTGYKEGYVARISASARKLAAAAEPPRLKVPEVRALAALEEFASQPEIVAQVQGSRSGKSAGPAEGTGRSGALLLDRAHHLGGLLLGGSTGQADSAKPAI